MTTIRNANLANLEEIILLYHQATEYQKSVAKKYWKGFDKEMIVNDITGKNQWIITIDDQIACIFCTTFSDPLIWSEKNNDPAVYLHRIATKPDFRGQGFMKQIVCWVTGFALKNDKKFIRMDTGSGNDKLNNYYISCGFDFLGTTALSHTKGLPEHYKDGTSSLFQLDLSILV
ncbi:GNAT family N-acetyltransferase [Dyadobacter frigoris]|uniref:GNAT family N-acetyltransferase n=1 Tax=Dyadobacter frigoris TaxID=2576211 RepID=A0A4U6CZZ2_9BACT|nr:GNAT family N-acetyltransferase [Dyadobacter frigoris]TKT90480.1 GNAT family N-acetyltransferase [Dyadobacter frigoris]GLU51390.1 N-acetyltransferase [Dyadobacter frigoris]